MYEGEVLGIQKAVSVVGESFGKADRQTGSCISGHTAFSWNVFVCSLYMGSDSEVEKGQSVRCHVHTDVRYFVRIQMAPSLLHSVRIQTAPSLLLHSVHIQMAPSLPSFRACTTLLPFVYPKEKEGRARQNLINQPLTASS